MGSSPSSGASTAGPGSSSQTLGRSLVGSGSTCSCAAPTSAELIEAQAIIQPGAVAQAARAHDDADIERLRRVVDDCNTARTNDDLIAAVEAFGEALLQASHNRVLSLYAELTAVLLREKLGEYVTESGLTKEQIAAVIRWSTAQYAELVDLIEAGEAERAEQFWQAYLRRAGATPSTEPSPFELYRPEH